MFIFQWLKSLFTRDDIASSDSEDVDVAPPVAPPKCDIQCSKPPVIEHDYSIELIETRLECDLGDIMSGTGAAHFTTDAHLAGLDLAAPTSVEKVESLRAFCREHGDIIFTIER